MLFIVSLLALSGCAPADAGETSSAQEGTWTGLSGSVHVFPCEESGYGVHVEGAAESVSITVEECEWDTCRPSTDWIRTGDVITDACDGEAVVRLVTR